MHLETWTLYAFIVVLWLALPSRAVRDIASYSNARGRLMAIATVPGYTLANVAVAMAAAYVALSAALVSPVVLTALQWFTGTLLVLGLVTRAVLPEFSAPIADNDNLREKHAPRIALDIFAETFFDRRTMIFFLAAATQMIDPASFAADFMVWLSVATAVPALLFGLATALAFETSLQRLKRRPFRKARKPRSGIVSIASGAVTAGYRKIAA